MIMEVCHFILVLLVLGFQAMAQNCPQGVCYGGTFSAKTRRDGQYLTGVSYKNLTKVLHAQGCFSACVNECRCKSYQVSKTGCELLDMDSSEKPLEANSDYAYFDLLQNIVPSAAYLAKPAECRNGCCLSNPCLNGGKCTEQCNHPKAKFACACPSHTTGRFCQHFTPKSCFDFYKAPKATSKPARGVYTVFKKDNITQFKVYCDFTSPKKAWTLIESYAYKYISEFKRKAFLEDYPINEATPEIHARFRLSREKMKLIRSTAVSYRATCKFLTRANVTSRDYMEGRLSVFDIIEETCEYSCCKTMTYIDIVGHQCTGCALQLLHKRAGTYSWHVHVMPGIACSFNAYRLFDENTELFGFYNPSTPTFLCTDSEDSTTEFWLGHET
ncbi:uncharacterized protein LOC5509929 isoform X2 [Nematostella vectensis]|uniref:uncharacterized protein LOC5509929 isoform X2 n=1 Tax=Nematostella vectensis TaxID=45351 RepID=UPI002077113C|nr:uncharacterized protein LOC5509929 isoform X2 [Nematostella vectensis]